MISCPSCTNRPGRRAAVRANVVRRPGWLVQEGLLIRGQYLAGARSAGSGDAESEGFRLGDGVAMSYYTAVLRPNAGPGLTRRSERELLTLAQAVDSILAGEVPEAAGLLLQRFRALEVASAEGNRALAKHLELVPGAGASSAPPAMRSAMLRREAMEQKIGSAGPHLGPGGGGRPLPKRGNS